MKVQLFGGPLDGHEVEVDGRPEEVLMPISSDPSLVISDSLEAPIIQRLRYVRSTINPTRYYLQEQP